MKIKLVPVFYMLNLTFASTSHSPEVHEEEVRDIFSEVVRKVRQPPETFQETFNPPVFIYNKAAQQDQQKWRYYQQQKVDSENMSKIQHLKKGTPVRAPINNSGQNHSESRQVVIKAPLDQKWKVVHPKFVTEKQAEEGSVDYFPEMPKDISNKNIRPVNEKIVPLTVVREILSDPSNKQKLKRTNKKLNSQSYTADDDLAVAYTEIQIRETPLERQDNVDLSNNFFTHPHTIYFEALKQGIPVNIPSGSGSKFLHKTAGNIIPESGQEREIDALNSLLGKTPTAQLHGLTRLLHSQAVHVSPLPQQDHTPIKEDVVDIENHQTRPNIKVEYQHVTSNKIIPENDLASSSLHIQPDAALHQQISRQPNNFNHLQAQLNAVSQIQANNALAQAQQKALEHVKIQHEAIALAKIQAEKIALAHVQSQNLALAQTHADAQAQAHAQNLAQTAEQDALKFKEHEDALNHKAQGEALAEKNQQRALIHQAEEELANANFLAKKAQQQALTLKLYQEAAEQIKAQNAQIHARRQAKAYSQLAAQEYAQHNRLATAEASPSTNALQVVATRSYSYPFEHQTANLHSVELLGTLQEAVQQFHPENAVEHAELQAQAYKQLAAQAYSQPIGDLQAHYVQPQEDVAHDESLYQSEHDEYASKYSFGYRIRDHHSGNDFGHEESKDGEIVKGRYDVLLPDGRVQYVEYWADSTGYHAKVSYSDVAHH